MLKVCPKCHNVSIDYDPRQKVERCLYTPCGWVNRKGEKLELQPLKSSITMEKRGKGCLKGQLEAG